MKIIIFNWRDIKNPLSGGAEISLFEHAKYWKKKGADITWFTASYKNAKNQENVDGIKTIRMGNAFTVHLIGMYQLLTGKLGKPDIIIDSFHGIPFFTVLFYPKNKIVALINEIAGKIWFVNTNVLIALIGFLLEKIALRIYRSIPFITGSESAKHELVQVGIPARSISVVNHGTHILKVSPTIVKEKDPVILFLGRINEDKGIKDALQAFAEVRKNIQEIQLWVAGGEEKKGAFNKILNELAYDEKQLTYFGFVSEEEKFRLIKKSWLLVHPSIKEGWGLTVIEAASQGVPTVGYNVAGLIDSVQNGKTGILVEPKNIGDLASAIAALIKDKKKYNNFSENAVQWSKQFTWDESVKKSWDIIKRVHESNKQ